MKKFLLFILFLLLSILSKAQNNFPHYYIKNGDTIGVVISIKQAQKIDNDYDLLSLLKKSKIEESKIDSAYVVVINNYGQEVAQLKLKISTMDDIDLIKDKEISNLRSQIDDYERDKLLSDLQLAKKDTIIQNYKGQVVKLKLQKTISFSVGGGLTLLGILLLLLK
jgi:hypothetical protein